MNGKRIYAGAATVLMLLLSACKMPGSGAGTGFGADGKAAVRIGIAASGIQARTIVPAVALGDVTGWELWGGPSSEGETLLAEFSGTTTTVYLETGTWTFTLKGYKAAHVILQGSIPNKNVTLEGPNALSFTVAPVAAASGTVAITVNLPPGHGITEAVVFIGGTLESKSSGNQNIIVLDGNVVTFEGDYSARDYFFSIRLYKGDDLYGVVSELAQIRDHLRSEKTYDLTLADLNRAYIITYHLNEGQFGGGVDNPGFYHSTDAAVTLPAPTRAGYAFEGWYATDAFDDGAIAVIPQGSMEDKDFYAKWDLNSYTVTFKSNDGTDNTLCTKYVTPATTIDAEDFPGNPSRSGYAFAGWDTASDGTGSSFGATTVVNANITVYAQWLADAEFTVTLNSDAGTGAFSWAGDFTLTGGQTATATITADSGYVNPRWFVDGDLKETANSIILSGAGYSLGKHYLTLIISKNGVSWSREIAFVVAKTLKAQLEAALLFASGTYTITLNGGETDLEAFATQPLNVTGNKDVTIILDGNGKIVKLDSNGGSLFTLSADADSKLTLELRTITLQGRGTSYDNNAPLVQVNSRGALVMKADSLITGNTNSGGGGGGVYVTGGGSFEMSGGAVSGNFVAASNATGGGGVYVTGANSSFTMSEGTVSDNTVNITNNGTRGGGVCVISGGSFEMSGGAVSDNTASSSGGNTAYGGGVYVTGTNSSFTMSGGTVSDNKATSGTGTVYGGGVCVISGGSFEMSGGTVSGNTASSSSSSVFGGGVNLDSGTFRKRSDGIIYGSNEDSALKNTVSGGSSNDSAVYVKPGGKRNATAGTGVVLYAFSNGTVASYDDSSSGGVGDTTANWE
jgi:uncharacterized repeat protein (TIGR02543 family)